jgi:uridine phosphorylase
VRHYVSLTRAQILALLATGTSPASVECVGAVRSGAPFRVHPGTVTREGALRVYALRAQTMRFDGCESFGIEEALKDLSASKHTQIRVGAVSSAHDFALFMDPECQELIACLGVEGRTAR